jgi:parallel beta-helix repeat protein
MSWIQVSDVVAALFFIPFLTGCGGSATLPAAPSTLRITSFNLPSGTAELAYSYTLGAEGGEVPYTWELVSGSLPVGLELDSTSGRITGKPTSAADSAVTIQVKGAAQATAEQLFALSVNPGSSTSAANTNYYVDSLAGSDGNAGTSSATPWRTIAKVNSARFNAGDHILFKRGGTWRELLQPASSGESGNPIVIDAYGAGAAPIVSGADVVPQSAWTLCSSCKSGVWRAAIATQPNIVLFNGSQGPKQISISGLLQAGDWYWDAGVLYVWGSMNPGSYYRAPGVEAGKRILAADLSALAYMTVQNLQFTGANGIPTNAVIYAHSQDGVQSHDLTLNNLVVTNGAGHGVHLEDCNHCVVRGLNVSGMASDGIRLVSLSTSLPITSASIVGNTVTNSHHDGIATYGCAIGGACQGISFPSGVFLSGVSISGNVVHDNGEGIYLEWTNHSSVSANTAYQNMETSDPAAEGGGIELEASSYNTIQENLVYLNRGNGVEMSNDAGAGTTLTGASHNMIEYNAIHDNGAHGLFTDDAPSQSNQFQYNLVWNQVNGECFLANGFGHTFYGNTCWHNSTGVDLYTSSSTPVTGGIVVKNNIIGDSLKRAVHIESGVNVATLSFDHNNYDFGSGDEFMLLDTTYTLAGWRSASGQDTHSFIANPDFVSSTPLAPTDFVIRSGSSDIGSGTTLGSTYAHGLAPGSAWPSSVATAAQPTSWAIGAFVVP